MKKILFFGLGSIGNRHAKILHDAYRYELFAYRSGAGAGRNNMGIKELYTWEEVKKLRPEIAFIANPTDLHIKTAIKCALQGMNLFIEKPLSHNLKGIDRLESICRRKKLTCYTAYCLRFHPAVKKIRELVKGKDIYHVTVVCSSFLPKWRENKDYKKSYSVSRRNGGGVLLDLSHEFDYIQYLFGRIKRIDGAYGRVSGLTRDSEDFCDALITFDNCKHANLHLDYFSRFGERTIKVDFEGGYLTGDLLKGRIDYSFRGKRHVFKLSVDRDSYLKEQIKYFLGRIGGRVMMNDLQESKKLLEKILEFRNG